MQGPVIDSLKAAGEKQQFAGRFAVADLTRLADCMEAQDTLDYVVAGSHDRQDRPQLRVRISGRVSLQCQRCLGALPHEVNIDSVLRLVPGETLEVEQDGNPEAPDCIAASSELDLAALVEDEVLLALPPYPRHEAGQCADKSAQQDTGSGHTAFGALAALKHKF